MIHLSIFEHADQDSTENLKPTFSQPPFSSFYSKHLSAIVLLHVALRKLVSIRPAKEQRPVMILSFKNSWLLGADKKKTAPNSQLGFSDRRPTSLNFKVRREWECLALKEDDSAQFHKDLSSLPKPLSAASLSSSDGANVRVAYKGIPGAFSEAAALKAFPKSETVPCDEFEAVFEAVELWSVDKAVLPIENSVGGSIHRNYDLLLRHRLHIVGEIQLIVNFCLLGLPGVRKEELKNVLSHPQALEQCGNYLNKLGVARINAVDTAFAAQVVESEGVRETGAIASARAAIIYGLVVLAQGIQDDSDNITRFLILAREPIIPGTEGSYKTSIVFTLEEGPGVLFKALAVFSMRDINLSKIESRPQKNQPLRVVGDSNGAGAAFFDYLFYIDFEASMAEPRAQSALAHLQEFARFIRVLGCYPKVYNPVLDLV